MYDLDLYPRDLDIMSTESFHRYPGLPTPLRQKVEQLTTKSGAKGQKVEQLLRKSGAKSGASFSNF